MYDVECCHRLPARVLGIRGRPPPIALLRHVGEKTKARVTARELMHRAGEADEVAAAMEFLFSEQASYISGVALPIDGAFLAG